MVRLGEYLPLSTLCLYLQFQFQYGAIGRIFEFLFAASQVRFNSSMVRLGAVIKFDRFYNRCVSIPVWCDWENPSTLQVFPDLLFQFQYGAIGRFHAESMIWM